MPSIPFYALDSDLELVLQHLNDDQTIAFVIPDGPRRWRAVEHRDGLGAGHHALWHRPGGNLPLLGRNQNEADEPIASPFEGWEERVAAATPGLPFFGSVPMVIWFHLAEGRSAQGGTVPMSAFGWIGDRYRAIGQGAPKETTSWWRALQSWVRRQTRPFPRGGTAASGQGTIAAFPGAAERLQAGMPGELNPPAP
jgi:hypothetical protein